MSLQQAVTKWDGKSAGYIADVYRGYVHVSTFVDQLVELIEAPASQRGATWLLKHHLEENVASDRALLDRSQLSRIYRLAPSLADWESRLHILQSIPQMPVAPADKDIVESFIRRSLRDKNKFVRAWAYMAFTNWRCNIQSIRQKLWPYWMMPLKTNPLRLYGQESAIFSSATRFLETLSPVCDGQFSAISSHPPVWIQDPVDSIANVTS